MITKFLSISLMQQLGQLLWPAERGMAVSPKWLLQSSSAEEQSFVKKAQVVMDTAGEFNVITVNGESYLWPKQAELNTLLIIASELTNPRHPHHYMAEKTTIAPGDVVIDIGACEGSFSARAAELGAEVIAVEPSVIMTRLIYALFELRGLPKPRVANTLLGTAAGEMHFVDDVDNPGASRIVPQAEAGSHSVMVTTLDDMVAELKLSKLNYIKCDAEGADVGILKSGRKTLEKFHPKIAVTTYHNSTDYAELFHYFRDLGYTLKGKGLLYSNGEFRVIMLHAW